LYSDIQVFDDELLVSGTGAGSDDISVWDGSWTASWWKTTKAQPALVSSRPHPMEVAQVGSPLLCIGDGSKLHTVTTSGTVSNTRLQLDSEQAIVWIKSGTSKIYIGCISTNGANGLVYEWDGGDTLPTRVYNTQTAGAVAGVVLDDTLYIINANGYLQVLAGGGFQTLNRFPFSRSQVPIDNSSFIFSNRRFIHPNGFIPYKGKILALVSIQSDTATSGFTSVVENNPAGIWEFNPDTRGLSHKYSVTLDKTGTKDFGQVAIPCDFSTTNRVPGALLETSQKKYTTPILAGCAVWIDAATTYKTAIYNLDSARTLTARGSVTYPKAYANGLVDLLAEVIVQYERMKSANDRLIIKYRTEVHPNLPIIASVTWTSTTTFTSTDTNMSYASVGDEVEILMGNGSGTTAHISSISYTNPTYTISVDEAPTGVSTNDTNYVRITNFKKLDSFCDLLKTNWKKTVLTTPSTWAQIKVELRSNSGESPVIERCVIITTEHTN
jgi:hypothetical protein